LNYQIDEIEKAEINPGEWEALKDRRSELQNFEKIQGGLYAAYEALSGGESFNGAVELLSGASRELNGISQFSSDLQALSQKISDLYYELEDVADTVRSSVNEDGFSQAELESVESRINLLYNLSKKYGSTEEEILEYLENAKKELSLLIVEHLAVHRQIGIKGDDSHRQLVHGCDLPPGGDHAENPLLLQRGNGIIGALADPLGLVGQQCTIHIKKCRFDHLFIPPAGTRRGRTCPVPRR
jgi:regulator of replication initiation timing